MVDLPKDPAALQKCHKTRLLSLSCSIHRTHTGSPSLLSDLCLKISPIVTNTSLNNNVLSLRLAGEYWREVCGASRRSGPAFAGGSAGAGGGPCLLLLRSRLLLLLPAWAENLGPRQPSNPRRSRCFTLFVRTLYVLSLYLNLFYIYLEYLVFHLFHL